MLHVFQMIFSHRVGGAESYNNSFYEFSITTFMRVEIHFMHYIFYNSVGQKASVHRQEMTKNKPALLHASNVSKGNLTPSILPFLLGKRPLRHVIYC